MTTICDICDEKIYISKYSRPQYLVTTVCCKSTACNVCLFRYMELYVDTIKNHLLNDEVLDSSLVGSDNHLFTNHCMFCKSRWSNSALRTMFNNTHLEKGFYELIKQLYSTIETYWSNDTAYRSIVQLDLIPLLKDVSHYMSTLKISRVDVPIIAKLGNYKDIDNVTKKWYKCNSNVIEDSRQILLNKCNKSILKSVDRLFDHIVDVFDRLLDTLDNARIGAMTDIGMDTLPDSIDTGNIDWKLVNYLRDELKSNRVYNLNTDIQLHGQFHEMINDIYRLRVYYLGRLNGDTVHYNKLTLSDLRTKMTFNQTNYNNYRKQIKKYVTDIHDLSVKYSDVYDIINILTTALADYSKGAPYYEVISYVISELGTNGHKSALEQYFNCTVYGMIKYYVNNKENTVKGNTVLDVLDNTGVIHSLTVTSRSDPALIDSLWQYDPYILRAKDQGCHQTLLEKYYKYRNMDSTDIPNNSTGYWISRSNMQYDIRDIALITNSFVTVQ